MAGRRHKRQQNPTAVHKAKVARYWARKPKIEEEKALRRANDLAVAVKTGNPDKHRHKWWLKKKIKLCNICNITKKRKVE